MVRSAAKNFESVGVVTDPADYAAVGEEIAARRRVEPRDAARAGAQGVRAHRALRRRNRDRTRAIDATAGARDARSSARRCPRDCIWRWRGARRCATAKIRISRRRSTRSGGADRGGNGGRAATAGERAFLQQSRGPRCGVGTGAGIRAARGRHREAQQSVRRGGAGYVWWRPTGARWRAIRCRRSAECWRSIARSTARRLRKLAKLFAECVAAPGYDAAARGTTSPGRKICV